MFGKVEYDTGMRLPVTPAGYHWEWTDVKISGWKNRKVRQMVLQLKQGKKVVADSAITKMNQDDVWAKAELLMKSYGL